MVVVIQRTNAYDMLSRRSNCPVACTLDLVGDKWTLLVIRDLILGKRYFEEFLRSPEGIASNILAARLGALVAHAYVSRSPDTDDRRKVVYRLTERGQELRLLLRYLARWGLRHLPDTELFEGG